MHVSYQQKVKRGPGRASRVLFLLRLGHGDTREKGDPEVDEEQAEAVLIAVVLLKGELVVNGGKREAPADGQNRPLKAVPAAWPCVLFSASTGSQCGNRSSDPVQWKRGNRLDQGRTFHLLSVDNTEHGSVFNSAGPL